MKRKHIPTRTCVGCRAAKAKKELIRVVRTPEGAVQLDLGGRVSGRGAYICASKDCFQKAIKTKQLQRALNVAIDGELIALLEKQLDE